MEELIESRYNKRYETQKDGTGEEGRKEGRKIVRGDRELLAIFQGISAPSDRNEPHLGPLLASFLPYPLEPPLFQPSAESGEKIRLHT